MLDGIIPLAMMGAMQETVRNVEEEVSHLGTGFTVKGVVESQSALPASGTLGDLYLVSGEGYASYVWDGSAWHLKDGDVATHADLIAALYS